MTEEEWLASDDPIAMLEALRDHWQGEEDELVSIIHRYLLACCRVIWALLPMEGSRLGVEAAERYIEGRATREEFAYAFGVAVGTDFMRSDFRVAIFKIKKVNRVSDSASAGMTQTYVAPL
jgi:hypothetical protein